MLLGEVSRKKKPVVDYSPLGQLQKLPQPIGINGGSYTYWVDVTKTPLKFTASDGSELGDKCRTLESIAKWMDKWAAEIWLEFLDGKEDLDLLRGENIIRIKKGRGDQQEHELNQLMGESKESGKKMEFPGCKVRMLQSWRSKLPKAIKTLGHDVEMQGYEDGSTVWACAFHTPKKFDIKKFEDKLRGELQMDGWMEVKPFDMVEE
jgi:hypothetical protein